VENGSSNLPGRVAELEAQVATLAHIAAELVRLVSLPNVDAMLDMTEEGRAQLAEADREGDLHRAHSALLRLRRIIDETWPPEITRQDT